MVDEGKGYDTIVLDLSLGRGQEVQNVLRDNDLRNKGWDPPTSPRATSRFSEG